jgi:uncharacterized Zn finger protein
MSYWSGSYYDWAPRKSAAERRANAARKIRDATRRGHQMSPIAVTGRKIAHTFWGKAWCDNLERYRDFAYRLERGRSYLRSGSVIDLKIEPGKIIAAVSGSSLYDVAIEIEAVKRDAWRAIQRDCAGGIASRIDLLSGRLSEPVMARLCADRTGLFPAPSAIRFTCSCPDHAAVCKHVAATMYGVGVRLDHAPDLLFTLRRVSVDELLASAVTALPATPATARVLAADGLAALFGIDLADSAEPSTSKPAERLAVPPRASRTNGTTSEVTSTRRTSLHPTTTRARSAVPQTTDAASPASKSVPRAGKSASPRLAAPGVTKSPARKPAPSAGKPAPSAGKAAPPPKKSAPSARTPTPPTRNPTPPANKSIPSARKRALAVRR